MSSPAPPVRNIRLQAEGRLLDERTLWRDRITRLANLNRNAVETLVARLGFDPVTITPRVMSGEIPIEHLLETIASSSGCEDDRRFIHRAWLTIFGREPNNVEERVLLRLLEEEGSRAALMDRISRMTEFHALISSRAAR